MVTKEQAKCDGQKWYEEGRCKSFTTCDDPYCDFQDILFTKDAINEKLNKERLELGILIKKKKEAKKEKDKVKIEELDKQMIDKTIGVMVMQQTLVDKFGMKGFGSAIGLIKAKREIRKWQNQLK